MRDPRRHHEKRHKDRNESFEDCLACGRDRAICRGKVQLHSFEEAWEWMLDFNIAHDWNPPVWFYKCRWCPGFHLCTAKAAITAWRVERTRRKWIAGGRKPLPAPTIREGTEPT